MEPTPSETSSVTRVLVVDDEKNIRSTLGLCLESAGCYVVAASNVDEALAAAEHEPFDIAFLDIRLEAQNGLDVLPRLLQLRAGLSVVMMTAYATVETAVEAVKRGASEYLPKPFSPAQVRHVLNRLVQSRNAASNLLDLQAQLAQAVPEADLTTQAPAMRTALEMVSRAAASDASILLTGESGTGKSVLARALHLQSPRHLRSFVTINCPTLSEELLASELFGHAKGSFTGAIRDQAGRVEAAEGGTLFLDEISEISTVMQSKLLRFLQERAFERLGETRTRSANVRIVAATNRPLAEDVRAGLFREDLFYRLNVISIAVPPLRERPEDILPLTRKYLAFFARNCGRATPNMLPEVESILQAYPWPGNLRELRNVVERAVILWPADVLEVESLPVEMRAQASVVPQLGGDFTLEQVEHEHLTRVLQRVPGQERAAQILGIDASTLWRKRKKSSGSSNSPTS